MKIATLAQDLASSNQEIRILPQGVFRGIDGRPEGLPGWYIDGTIAANVIAASLSAGTDLLIDYEHQSLRSAKNGQPVPAAGWFSQMEWREGSGMYALGVQWTDKAKAMIAAREYRYISPVILYNNETGNINRLLSLAITNTPALTGLADLSPAALNRLTAPSKIDPANQNGYELLRRMNEANESESVRLAKLRAQGPTVPQFTCTDPRNERGIELLRRMVSDR